jgi:fumarate hydratase class II
MEDLMGTRIERDTFGTIEVPDDRLWGAQTQRALIHFRISSERMPMAVVRALALVKKVVALVNVELGLLPPSKGHAIAAAADEVLAGRHDEEFPLVVWQTGSGTQTNMNVNEVLANRASEILGGERGQKRLVHPNDDVNQGQSSNDVFPTAMSLAAVQALREDVLPEVAALRDAFDRKARAFADVVKLGRTHLQDATPLTLGQELSGYVAQLDHALSRIEASLPHLCELALGGTAVGTGFGADPELGVRAAARLAETMRYALVSAPSKFEAMAAHDALVGAHAALRSLAVALHKVANDIRWLASGPRGGIGEIRIPENEPGSSIMPGKVNPTQSEAVMMIACQVIANDVAIGIAGASGSLELNTFKPVLIFDFLMSARLIAEGCRSFRLHCVDGIEPDRDRIRTLLEGSLMLVTALAPHIGYDGAASIAKRAHETGQTLREVAVESGLVSEEQFDAWVRPERMTRP